MMRWTTGCSLRRKEKETTICTRAWTVWRTARRSSCFQLSSKTPNIRANRNHSWRSLTSWETSSQSKWSATKEMSLEVTLRWRGTVLRQSRSLKRQPLLQIRSPFDRRQQILLWIRNPFDRRQQMSEEIQSHNSNTRPRACRIIASFKSWLMPHAMKGKWLWTFHRRRSPTSIIAKGSRQSRAKKLSSRWLAWKRVSVQERSQS